MTRRRSQRRIVGLRRITRAGALIPELERRVQAEADQEGVSCSFVVAVRLAASYGLRGQEQFRDHAPRRR